VAVHVPRFAAPGHGPNRQCCWLHKGGLSLCLNNNNVYSLIQFWQNFDNLQITNVTQPCP
jgi:hypothetical protein